MAAAVPLMQKACARVAVVNLDEFTTSVLRECFSQFGVRVVPLTLDSPEQLREEKFEACAIGIDATAKPFLEAVRESPLNSRIVIYGVCTGNGTAGLFSKYGINAALSFPPERAEVLKVVRASRLLLVNEFRRYVRVPMTLEVSVISGHSTCQAWSEEISAGGMSLRLQGAAPAKPATVVLSFSLPGSPKITVTGEVCWSIAQENRIGVRFAERDRARYQVRSWIENFLRIA